MHHKTQDNKTETNMIEEGRQILRNLSNQDFLAFGVNQIAYIKPIQVLDKKAFALYGADGAALAVIDSFEGAMTAVHQNDMEAVTLQ